MSDSPKHTVKDLPADDQPREKARKFGISSLSNADLFSVILRTGTQGYPVTELCRDMMEANKNSLLRLERWSREEILEIKGIGPLKALQIEAVLEIIRRFTAERVDVRKPIVQSSDIYELMRYEIGNLPHEEIRVILLNRANYVIDKIRVSEGGAVASVFDVKKIMRKALVARAEGMVMCHNHPSGNLRPSPQDDAITRSLDTACRALDIRLLDHLIVTVNGYYSYRDSSNIL